MNSIFSCYLTGREDPQRGHRWSPNDRTLCGSWSDSICNRELWGTIFHDELTHDFIDALWRRTCSAVNCIKTTWQTPWTAAEERVRIYRDYLKDRDFSSDKVLLTDLSDVEFYYDPFPLMTDPAKLYIGSEPVQIARSPWMIRRMKETYGEVTDPEKPILNPGIIGGSLDTVLAFLEKWLDEMGKAVSPTLPPHDIVAFNRIIYREKIPFVTGHPLHTVFRKNEGPECGAAIKHK